MTSAMLPADHAVREQALDPTRSFIVEAPAGSGKTELLTRRYLRLLATVRAPEEILAITFTRKAAAEMRSRVLKALALASSDTPPEKSMERSIWPLARAVREADRKHGWQLLTHPARLRIMTIDALNSLLARQLPILSGAGAGLGIARDAKTLYADVVLRLIERLSVRDSTADAIARLLWHLDNQYGFLEELLSLELARREHWLDLGLMRFDTPALRARLETTLATVVGDELVELTTLIPRDAHDELIALASHAAAVLNATGVESDITNCDGLLAMPETVADALTQWQGIATLLLTDEGSWRVKLNKNHGFPPDDKPTKRRIEALIARLQREDELDEALHRTRKLPTARYSDAQWQVLTDLLDVLKLAIAELELVMRERGEADYVANAIAARRALGSINEPTDLALRLDYRLQHLLVDEFQDTSRGQIELLALLTAGWMEGDGRTLFCVGDPMQSIYRFRHADVGLFLNLKRHGLNQLRLQPLRLTVNFRSTVPVLEWVNTTFARALPKHDDPDRGAVAFTTSEPQAAAQITGGVVVHPILGSKEQAREAEAQQIAALIADTLASKQDGKIAVLVSNRLHLQWIVRALQAHSIAFQAVDIDPLIERPVVQDLIALTRALVHLADRPAWLSVLRAPWCGLSLADLHALCGEVDADATVWSNINDALSASNSEKAPARAQLVRIHPILAHSLTLRGRISLRDCVERTWHALGGPATLHTATALQDAIAYFDRLEEIERTGDIEDIARLEDHLRDLYARADTSGDARVELMTVHRAKGLEFDVVILPGLDSSTRSDDPPLLRVQELPQVEDERALLLAPIAARGSEKEPIYAWLEQLDKERARLEKGRLLYVAATRAVRELHLFGAVEAGGQPRAHTFLHLLWPVVEPAFATATSLTNAPVAKAAVTRSVMTTRLPLSWQMPLPDAPFSQESVRDVIEDQPLHPEFEWVGETARHIGTLVHREVERFARVGVAAIDADHIEREHSRYRVELAELGVPPHLRDYAIARVSDALTKTLRDERGRWLLMGEGTHRDAASELALSGVLDGQVVNVVIDRTFVDSEGTRWVVDFKTSSHEGGGLTEFLESEVQRYRLQLSRYVRLLQLHRPQEPIKAALYFPLLGAWQEVRT